MAYRNYSTAVSHVVDTTGQGDFTTIQAAITAASSGMTIFVRPGTYTENLTLKAGVDITAYGSDSSLNNTGNVQITGKATFTGAGTVTISGIQLNTNSDYLLVVSGSAASIVNLNNCYLNCSNNTGISYTSSSGSSGININSCYGDLGTTGIGLYTMTGAGNLFIYYSIFTNSGGSTTASSNSSGLVFSRYSRFLFAFSTTSTGAFSSVFSTVDTSAINTIGITTAGSGSHGHNMMFIITGTASAISVGIGTTVQLIFAVVTSSNTNALTGAGTLNTYGLSFPGTSHQSNVTTQINGAIYGMTQGTAPSAGSIGEQITANASSVATSNGTPKSIANISLTPGIWDVSCMAFAVPTGGTAIIQAIVCGVSSTNNTLSGTAGINYNQINNISGASNSMGVSVVPQRITLSSTTTYYVVVQTVYTSTTCPVNAIITATRVG